MKLKLMTIQISMKMTIFSNILLIMLDRGLFLVTGYWEKTHTNDDLIFSVQTSWLASLRLDETMTLPLLSMHY